MAQPLVETGIDKILSHFNWNIKGILGDASDDFVTYMRVNYKDNTRRMFCSKLSKVFESDYTRDQFTESGYAEAMNKWNLVRKAIQVPVVLGANGTAGGEVGDLLADVAKYREVLDTYNTVLGDMFKDNAIVLGALKALQLMAEKSLG